ncbi:MAG: tetratricopeptide repeat protein [bacterium]|nr:tetratricopeptide repeat protein [bacterium]
MSLRLASLLAVATFSAACAVWDPDWEPDPDQHLRQLLAPFESDGGPREISRERLRAAVERLAARHPSHLRCQVAAAILTFDNGDRLRAQGYADQALAIAPDHVEARALRVRIAVADGNLDLARRLVDDGLQQRPESATLHESSAWVHQLKGEPEAALAALGVAERLGAPRWRTEYNRGLLAEERNDLAAAERHYEAALATAKEGEGNGEGPEEEGKKENQETRDDGPGAEAGRDVVRRRLAGLRARRGH